MEQAESAKKAGNVGSVSANRSGNRHEMSVEQAALVAPHVAAEQEAQQRMHHALCMPLLCCQAEVAIRP